MYSSNSACTCKQPEQAVFPKRLSKDSSLHRAFEFRPPNPEVAIGNLPVLFMAHVNKKQTTSSDAPLSDREINMTVGLLHRAVAFGQVRKLMDVYKNSMAPKSELVPAAALLKEMNEVYQNGPSPSLAGMSDAAKRRMIFDEDEVSEWDNISAAGSDFFPPDRGASPKHAAKPNMVKESPDGVPLAQWGKNVCKMPKVKSLGLTYDELISRAKWDEDIHGYLSWIKSTYGTGETGAAPEKITAAVDLALYMEAINWKGPKDQKSSKLGFTRTYKD